MPQERQPLHEALPELITNTHSAGELAAYATIIMKVKIVGNHDAIREAYVETALLHDVDPILIIEALEEQQGELEQRGRLRPPVPHRLSLKHKGLPGDPQHLAFFIPKNKV